MFTTFLQTISGYFNKRFILSAFFPSLVLGGLSLLLYASLQGPKLAVERWNAQPTEWRVFLAVAFFAASLFLAYLLQSFSTGLTRLYEGYWRGIPLLSRWGQARRRFHQRRWDYLSSDMKRLASQIKTLERQPPTDETLIQEQTRLARINELYVELGHLEREWFLFHPPERAMVMPTRLGNTLRAAEAYPSLRYKLDAVVTWPRLHSVLPEAFASELQDAKATLDLLLNLTTLTILFTLSWELYFGLATHYWNWFLVVSIGWIVAIVAYQAAVLAAKTYGELIKAAYDLHRWELLSALHLQRPTSYSEEQSLWDDVTALLYRNYPPNSPAFRYETAKKQDATEPLDRPGIFERLLRWLQSLVGGNA